MAGAGDYAIFLYRVADIGFYNISYTVIVDNMHDGNHISDDTSTRCWLK